MRRHRPDRFARSQRRRSHAIADFRLGALAFNEFDKASELNSVLLMQRASMSVDPALETVTAPTGRMDPGSRCLNGPADRRANRSAVIIIRNAEAIRVDLPVAMEESSRT